MVKSYCAFLLRCWRLGDGAQRIEVTQVQSGERTLVTSLVAALAWIGVRAAEHEAGHPVRRDPEDPAAGEAGDAVVDGT